MMRRGRLSRLARLGGMAAGLVGDVAGATAHLVTETAEEAAAGLHRHAAERMLKVLGDMKGLPLKAGQMLSYIDEIIPESHRHIYNEMLGKLQMHTPAMDWSDVEEIFEEDFMGSGPMELFRDFDPEPIAAASIGQVYHAVLHDGAEVAVKVQYPGVAEAIRSDLDNLEALVGAMSHLMPKADFTHFVEDIARRVLEECDYEQERHNQRDFYYCWLDDSEIAIPRVYEDLCRRRVLVSEFVHALEWKEMLATADPERKSRYGRVIFRFVFQSLFKYAMFNGDPHPGNYLFHPDGRITFIDFGCVQRYPEDQADAFEKLRDAVLVGARGEDLFDLVHTVFGVPEDLDEDMKRMLAEYLQLTFEPVTSPQPYRFTREYSGKLLKKAMEIKPLMTMKMLQGKQAYPLDLQRADGGIAFLGRINFGLGSILSTLGTEADFRELLQTMGD